MKGVFITGTDTGVGKTVASAAFLIALRFAWVGARYWKPIQTGIEIDDDTKTVRRLAGCGDGEIFDNGFRLERPLSPHLSSRLSGVDVSVDHVTKYLKDLPNGRFNVVEGAGGLLVPINESEFVADLIRVLNLPVVIVARSTLGTINHTLLTLEAARKRDLSIVGIVINGPLNLENARAIEYYGDAPVIATFPEFKNDLTLELRAWARTHSARLTGPLEAL